MGIDTTAGSARESGDDLVIQVAAAWRGSQPEITGLRIR